MAALDEHRFRTCLQDCIGLTGNLLLRGGDRRAGQQRRFGQVRRDDGGERQKLAPQCLDGIFMQQTVA
ncbi:hypothetical protein D3C71_2033860 [compost metagenome]